MKNKEIEIPMYDPFALVNKLSGHGEGGDNFTRSHIKSISKILHINRVEDYVRLIPTPTPTDLTPFRLTVFNFIFLTKGKSVRSKGLNRYEFQENTFFFLPAYEITTHEFIDSNYEGFYCDFSLELLTQKVSQKELFEEFPFLEFPVFGIPEIRNSYCDSEMGRFYDSKFGTLISRSFFSKNSFYEKSAKDPDYKEDEKLFAIVPVFSFLF